MAKKKDDVTLPEKPKAAEPVEDKPKVAEPMTESEPESEDTHTLPPAEDVQEISEELGLPPSPDATVEAPSAHERVKLLQDRDVAALESKYAAWAAEKNFEGRDVGGIKARHVVDGGNGLLHLAVFYVD